MSGGLLAATILQTVLISAFLFVLTPFRMHPRKALAVIGTAVLAFAALVGLLTARYGTLFLYQYGFALVGVPLFCGLRLCSDAKGFRFVFVALTAMLFHQMLVVLLMTFRVWDGGSFTALYFLLNLLLFGALILGGWHMRSDFHKIIFTFQTEFRCLCPILLLLFVLIRWFSPIVGENEIDYDLFLLAIVLDLLIVLLYVYIAVSFRSLSARCDAERSAVSLGHRMEEAQKHISLLRSFQESSATQRHDLRHHFALMEQFLQEGQMDRLRAYLEEARRELDEIIPPRFCQNEAANLLLLSFENQAREAGVTLRADTHFPNSLPIGNTELCALLSNAMENAIHAAREVEDRPREVRMTAELNDGKLLLLVENACAKEVRMEHGLPRTDRVGHGLGVRSIAAIVERYGGLYSFEAKDGWFTLRIAI